MQDISVLKEKFEKIYAKRCFGNEDISQCPLGDKCECKKAAEIKAYMYAIIGSLYYKYSIWDFNGYSGEYDQIVEKDILIEAKRQVLCYCWKNISLDDLQKNIYSPEVLGLERKSIIDKRRKFGTNVVIYSTSNGQSGKTFVASIIMREAIKSRVNPANSMHTYDWVKFPKLLELTKEKDDPSLLSMRYADWLVIDDIGRMEGMKRTSESYVTTHIDPFFIDRLESQLPTIFVFKFDINAQSVRWEEKFGVAISNIIRDPKTFKIRLN